MINLTPNTIAMLNQLPGYYLLKSTDSTFCFATRNIAQLVGFASPEDLIGLTDHDIKCAAAQYAEEFIQEDKLTLHHQKLKFLSHQCYANDNWKTFIYEKNVIKGADNLTMGVSCYMTDITDCYLIDLTRYLLKTDGKYHYEICKEQFSYILNDTYFNNSLSERETECLFFTLRGKSSKTIGKILNLSAKTVEYYIDQLKIKLNCKNKAELIEHALTNGYLNVLPNRLINTKLIEQIASD